MSIRLFTPDATHVPELGRICFEAFGALQDRHAVERDFPSPDVATMVVGMFAARPDVFAVAAEVSGRIVGSNYIAFADPVASVGPITVDPRVQAGGVGRELMKAVMREAERRGVACVRLMQEAINTASLSLYSKLGFQWRECCALMQPVPAGEPDPRVRPMTADDLIAVDRISGQQFHFTRRGEVEIMLRGGVGGVVMERGGGVTGYFIPGLLGHGFAASHQDMLTLIGQAMRLAPPMFHRVIVPLGEHDTFTGLLRAGGRTVKMFNLMSTGPYRRPTGAWIPSIGC